MAIKDINKGLASVIIAGEHAVVYKDRPAISMTTPHTTTFGIIPDSSRSFSVTMSWDDAEQKMFIDEHVDVKKSLDQILAVIKKRLKITESFNYAIHSNIPIGFGFGSSAALGVSITRALNAHFKLGLTEKEIIDVAYEAENLHHKRASGIDNTTSSMGGLIWFVKGKDPIRLKHRGSFYFIMANSGVSKNTQEAIEKVEILREKDSSFVDGRFDLIETLTYNARTALETGDVDQLGSLMNENHEYLSQLGVSHPALETVISIMRSTGVVGAKLTGGGLGGCALGLAKNEEQQRVIAQTLIDQGHDAVQITLEQ